MHRILVLGAGFAGLWSAVAAARRLDELGAGPDEVEVLVVNRTAWHSIRVRNYEADLDATLVPLAGTGLFSCQVADFELCSGRFWVLS